MQKGICCWLNRHLGRFSLEVAMSVCVLSVVCSPPPNYLMERAKDLKLKQFSPKIRLEKLRGLNGQMFSLSPRLLLTWSHCQDWDFSRLRPRLFKTMKFCKDRVCVRLANSRCDWDVFHSLHNHWFIQTWIHNFWDCFMNCYDKETSPKFNICE